MLGELRKYVYAYPDLSDTEMAKKVVAEKPDLAENYKTDSIRRYISFLRELPADFTMFPPKLLHKTIEEFLLDQQLIKKRNLVKEFNAPPELLDQVVANMKVRGYNIKATDEYVQLLPFTIDPTPRRVDVGIFNNGWWRFGVVGDTHLASLYERLDVLEALYDIFQAEGITTVFQCGNWIEGEAIFNKHEVKVRGIDGQVEYFTDLYPFREGITTYFISGDDHEGWYQKREGFRNIGLYAQMVRERKKKNDLKWLGYEEATIEIAHPETGAIAPFCVMHAGGGSCYAVSYSLQKIIESLINKKPAVLAVGHYHKAEYLFYRNVHGIQAGCVQDQSIFMRKQKIQAHIGGWIIRFNQGPDGAVNRFTSEFLPFFDERYYERRGYYVMPDKVVLGKINNEIPGQALSKKSNAL